MTTGGDVTREASNVINRSGGNTGLSTDASQPGWLERNLGEDISKGIYQSLGTAAITQIEPVMTGILGNIVTRLVLFLCEQEFMGHSILLKM